jgi:hypothetical protein
MDTSTSIQKNRRCCKQKGEAITITIAIIGLSVSVGQFIYEIFKKPEPDPTIFWVIVVGGILAICLLLLILVIKNNKKQ